MKLIFTIMLMACMSLLHAQAIELKGGLTLFPSEYVSLGYEHYTNSFLNVAGRLFTESSGGSNLNYSAYGLDVFMQTALNTEQKFSARASFGATIQKENEPWIYKDLVETKKINYGMLAELSGNWIMSENFSLSLFAQQKLLFNKALGLTRFAFGLGLRYQFPHY